MNIRNPSHQLLRRLPYLAALPALAMVLVWPVHVAFDDLGWAPIQAAQLMGSLALIAALALLPSLLPRPLAAVLLTLILATMLIIRLSFFGLVQFSGAGFSNEVFIHLEPKSFALAWEQYRILCLALLVMLAGLPVLVWVLVVRQRLTIRFRYALVLLLGCLTGVAMAHHALPEWMLAEKAHAWFTPKALDLPADEIQRWRESGLVELDLPTKSSVHASAAAPIKNLILIYLESLGQRVIEHPDYPDLMPNLARRLHSSGVLKDYFAAGYITIEGITNSQCGTLFPFDHNSESLAGFDGMAEQQPCLGDVLHRAGYTQSYLGGADTGFAGKGHFLSAHGYDRVLGFSEWSQMGLKSRPGGWGLGDPDLFEQAWLEVQSLRQSGRPFNLTLLTIGSHLPGYSYEECTPYGSQEPFIEALHCTDQLLEDFIGRLENAAYLEDTVVVVTADHHVFPNPLMKRLFGTDAVNDRRLPLVVLGAAHPQNVATVGASYDLAPTLLDLLGVNHDVRFPLGRSLLRPETTRDYFPTRYADIFAGEPVNVVAGDCAGEVPQPPLRACDKEALQTLLRMQNAKFSRSTGTYLDCSSTLGTRVRIPEAEGESIQFLVNGENQAQRFTWNARPGQEARAGLFVAGFAADGELVERRFIPAAEASRQPQPPLTGQAGYYLLAWRSDRGTMPAWLAGHGSAHASSVVIDSRGQLVSLPSRSRHGFTEFFLPADLCNL